ncbi:CHASE2 domain-containing protein [bacterium]|nr:CHASE2 domain-containing protein [bacterium]
MNKIKNKWFYLYSFLSYVLLIMIFVLLSNRFIKPISDVFLISNFATGTNISNDVIEVVIDTQTDEKYHWVADKKNEVTADFLSFFHKYAKPKAVGLDVTFFMADDKLNKESTKFVNQVYQMDNLVSAFAPVSSHNDVDTDKLSDFAKKHSLNVKIIGNVPDKTEFNDIITSSKFLKDRTHNYGSVLIKKGEHSNYVFDSPSIIKIGDSYYPSLPLKVYLLINKTNDVIIYKDYILIPKTGLKLEYTYDDGCFNVPLKFYRSPYIPAGQKSDYTHIAVQGMQILDTFHALEQGITPETHPQRYDPKNADLINPERFNDKIIFIGANISGPSDDVLATPINNRHPGVDIQTTSFDNFYSDVQMHNIGIGVGAFFFMFLCVLSFIVILRMPFIRGIISLIGVDVIYMLFVIILAISGYRFNYSTPLVCQFVTAVFAYSFKFLNESRNKEQIKTAMGKYISKDVMNSVVKNIDTLGLGGKRAIVTVLFSDIRGFTSMSEKMSAEDVSKILNEYFAEMEPIINKYNGVINKFIGDAIMVIFGEPVQDINHPRNAVKCAYEMLKRVNFLREKWLEEGRPRFEIGVGINTGEVFIGNIGTENRMEYTVIGDSVNLASRIEGYNKVYKTNLLVSSSTYNYISDCADVIKIKEVQIRGKSKKMDIYEVLRIDLDK